MRHSWVWNRCNIAIGYLHNANRLAISLPHFDTGSLHVLRELFLCDEDAWQNPNRGIPLCKSLPNR